MLILDSFSMKSESGVQRSKRSILYVIYYSVQYALEVVLWVRPLGTQIHGIFLALQSHDDQIHFTQLHATYRVAFSLPSGHRQTAAT